MPNQGKGPAPGSSDEAVATAEDLGAIRRRVINVIGHELRTPVTTVHGLAEQLAAATDLQQVTDVLGPALLRTAERLTVLLDDLLIASGIDTAMPVEEPEEVDLRALLHRLWRDVGTGGDLSLRGGGSAHVPAVSAERALGAVLANAAHYGTEAPTVTIDGDDAATVVTVTSPGPPLGAADARLAPEPFYRGERAVTIRPGLGLGLTVARRVLEHVGGSLRFAADAVHGTVTALTFPTARARDEEAPGR